MPFSLSFVRFVHSFSMLFLTYYHLDVFCHHVAWIASFVVHIYFHQKYVTLAIANALENRRFLLKFVSFRGATNECQNWTKILFACATFWWQQFTRLSTSKHICLGFVLVQQTLVFYLSSYDFAEHWKLLDASKSGSFPLPPDTYTINLLNRTIDKSIVVFNFQYCIKYSVALNNRLNPHESIRREDMLE